jgi:hypothetical protein
VPFYHQLAKAAEPERSRAIDGILALRQAARAAGIPERNLQDTLLLATWNPSSTRA